MRWRGIPPALQGGVCEESTGAEEVRAVLLTRACDWLIPAGSEVRDHAPKQETPSSLPAPPQMPLPEIPQPWLVSQRASCRFEGRPPVLGERRPPAGLGGGRPVLGERRTLPVRGRPPGSGAGARRPPLSVWEPLGAAGRRRGAFPEAGVSLTINAATRL